jgi:hypothetical protein
MGARLRGWAALPWGDRGWLFLMMLVGLPVVATSVHLAGYARTRRWLERSSPNIGDARTTSAANFASARQLANLAAIAGRRGLVTATCLRQSLLVYWLLRRRGLAPELKLGVRKQGAVVDAHAWVELDGKSLDPVEATHLPFPTQPAGPTSMR